MTIHINKEAHEVAEATSLQNALSNLQFQQTSGIAVAINEEVIPRQQWSERLLRDQDQVLIITATQGG
ncbi:MAG: sulfur carrier protein ThiS [Bacteroidota bacterium]